MRYRQGLNAFCNEGIIMLPVANTTTSNGRMLMTIIIPPLASLLLGTGLDVLDVPLLEEP